MSYGAELRDREEAAMDEIRQGLAVDRVIQPMAQAGSLDRMNPAVIVVVSITFNGRRHVIQVIERPEDDQWEDLARNGQLCPQPVSIQDGKGWWSFTAQIRKDLYDDELMAFEDIFFVDGVRQAIEDAARGAAFQHHRHNHLRRWLEAQEEQESPRWLM